MKFIKTLQVPVEQLQPYPGNAKLHAEDELDGSVARFKATGDGQFRSVLARQLEDGQIQLLAGHGTTDALVRSGSKKVRVELITADEDEALAIVLADNEIGRAAGYDERKLADLLTRLEEVSPSDLVDAFAGTGFSSQAYDDLMAKLAVAADTPLPLGEDPDDNTWQTKNMQDLRDRYETKGTRTVSFDYSYPVFVWLAEQLAILREQRGEESNSALFVTLVIEATGSTPPEALDDEAGPEEPEDAPSATSDDPDGGEADGDVAEALEEAPGAQADRIGALARAHEGRMPTAGGERFA